MTRPTPRQLPRLLLLAWLLGTAACRGTPATEFPGGPLVFSLSQDADTGDRIVSIAGWSSSELRALAEARMPADAWSQIIRLTVDGFDDVAVAADYQVHGDRVEIAPRFGLDPGRTYVISVDTARLPVPRPATAAPSLVSAPLLVPSGPQPTAAAITAIYPSGSVWPENTLRFYLHFSVPMSAESAVGRVRLVDDQGQEVADALLDIDVDLWNLAYTRRTVFFDPGRVKQDIRPNRELGRALEAGRRYAIVVDTEWHDARGLPLAAPFRHEFTAGPPIEQGLDPKAWSMAPPAAGSRDPLMVRFPWALDEGLLHRAVGVTAEDGTPIDGEITVGPGETSWTFTPAAAWARSPHTLVVLSLLEDPSGNKVGEPFEFEMFEKPVTAEPERLTLPFQPR